MYYIRYTNMDLRQQVVIQATSLDWDPRKKRTFRCCYICMICIIYHIKDICLFTYIHARMIIYTYIHTYIFIYIYIYNKYICK